MLAPMPLFYGQLWIKNEAIALAVMLIFYRFACPSLSYMLRTLFEARFPLLFSVFRSRAFPEHSRFTWTFILRRWSIPPTIP